MKVKQLIRLLGAADPESEAMIPDVNYADWTPVTAVGFGLAGEDPGVVHIHSEAM